MNIEELFDLVHQEKASDLIISAGSPPVLRINGQLFRSKTKPLTAEQTRKLIFGFLSEGQESEFEEKHELDLSLVHGPHRFRVNVYLQKGAVTAALRPIPEEIPAIEDLGLPEAVNKLTYARQGLVLVTGPTGHGKTTTQAAIVDRINTERACHIITVEDPIEYVHHHKKSVVDQREVGGDTDSFARALKFVLRQDPDVILVGEMRDLETIQSALTAAETGHLVFATLHTNDAIQTVDRIIDVFPANQQQQIRFQLSMTLKAIISQKLLPRANGDGRVLACEVLHNTTATANLIRDGNTHQLYSVVETSAREGMITMDQAIKKLYKNGDITFEEAQAHMRNPKELSRTS